MIALAASLDIPLYFVMVRTSAAGRVEREGAASLGAFNHAALYSPRLKRFFDPTVSHHDTWALPHEDQGAQALLVDPLGAAGEPSEPSAPKQLTVIPYLKPSRELNSLSLSLETPARAQGAHADTEERRWTLAWSLWGVEAAQARQLLEGEGGLGEPSESSEGQLQERLKQWLMARLIELSPHASPLGLEVSGLTPARDPLTLSARLTLPSTTLSVHLEALLKGWRLLPKYAPTSQRRSPWRQRPVALELKVPELSAAALEPLRLPQAPPLSPLLPEGCCQVEASREGGEVRLRLSLSGGELSAAAYLARRRWLSEVEGELLRWAKAYEARWR
jgi:hypothetical protein